MEEGVRSGTLTFLFTDVEQSTAAWDRHGAKMAEAMRRHDAIVVGAIGAHHGLVFSHGGDGAAAVFARATDALAAACDAQRALTLEPWPPPIALRVRMGLHTGVAEPRDGNYFGTDVNRTARVMSLGRGGHVLVTAATAVLAAHGPWTVVDRGRHRLRGFDTPDHIFQVVAEGFPDVGPLDSAEDVGNVPRTGSSLIGREDVLGTVQSAVRAGALVTLVGPGGVGKTRLAVAAAHGSTRRRDGTWFVDLSGATTDGDVPAVTVAALGLYASSPRLSSDDVARALVAQERVIVLDNCEHVIDEAARLAGALRDRCPHVAVLATSREPLGVTDEQVIRVEPLDVARQAVALLASRIAAQASDFDPSPTDLAFFEGICRLVDGLPLGIELAAARVPALGAAAVYGELLRSLDLTDRRRDVPDRHKSLRDAVGWSLDLLADDERLLLEDLSVFAGTFDLADAEAVCRCPPRADRVSDRLVALADKSLVAVVRTDDGVRYRLLATVRAVAADHLHNRGATTEIQARLVDHYTSWVGRAGLATRGSEEASWHRAFLAEWDNLRVAFRLAVAAGNVDAALTIVRCSYTWALPRWYFEVGEWAETAATMPGVSAHAGYPVALVASYMAGFFRDGERAAHESLLHEARDHEAIHGSAPEPDVPLALAFHEALRGDGRAARAMADDVLQRTDSLYWRVQAATRTLIVPTLQVQASASSPEETAATRRALHENVRLAEQVGNPALLSYARWYLGCAEPDPDLAIVQLEHAIASAEAVGLRHVEAHVVADLARALVAGGRPDDALATGRSVARRCRRSNAFGAARTICLSLGAALVATERYDAAAVVAAAVATLTLPPLTRAFYLPTELSAALGATVGAERLEQLGEDLARLDPVQLVDRLIAVLDDEADAAGPAARIR